MTHHRDITRTAASRAAALAALALGLLALVPAYGAAPDAHVPRLPEVSGGDPS